MAHPDVPAKVIETIRGYFRRLIAAGGEMWLEHWFDVARELTLSDARISARNKELWLSVVDQMEQEFLTTPRTEGAATPGAACPLCTAPEREGRTLHGRRPAVGG